MTRGPVRPRGREAEFTRLMTLASQTRSQARRLSPESFRAWVAAEAAAMAALDPEFLRVLSGLAAELQVEVKILPMGLQETPGSIP